VEQIYPSVLFRTFFILKVFPKYKVLETEVDALNNPIWASVTAQ
jgi:hypothetical protein